MLRLFDIRPPQNQPLVMEINDSFEDYNFFTMLLNFSDFKHFVDRTDNPHIAIRIRIFFSEESILQMDDFRHLIKFNIEHMFHISFTRMFAEKLFN